MSNMIDKNQDCVWVGIGVNIQKSTSLYQTCLRLNKVLRKEYGSTLRFLGSEVPHLNLYDLDVPRDNLRTIVERLQTLLQGQKSFNVKIKPLNYFPFGLFFLEIETTTQLSHLHRALVEAISPLKGECVCEDYLQPHRSLDSEQNAVLKLHGNPYVLGCFKPHITVGHIRNQDQNLDSIRRELNTINKTKELLINNIHVVFEENGARRELQVFHFD